MDSEKQAHSPGDVSPAGLAKSSSFSSDEKVARLGAETAAALAHINVEDENRLIRHQDIRILPVIALTYLLAFIDRTNLGNARVAGLEADLGLQTYGESLSRLACVSSENNIQTSISAPACSTSPTLFLCAAFAIPRLRLTSSRTSLAPYSLSVSASSWCLAS